MSVKSQLISTAQWYGRAGFPVFPIHWPEQDGCSCRKSDCPSPAKHPLTPHGFQDASQDRAMITEWWSRWPAANIGLTTGTPSGLLVVDIDPRNGGDRSLQTVIAKNGNLPATAQQFTGGGGRHFFFRYSGGRVPKTLAEGIDLKGDGGYVVIAPSRHCSGGDYRWAGEEGKESLLRLAEAPDWLQTFIATPKNDGPHPEPKNVDGKFGKGQRNNRLTSLAGTIQRCGMAPEAIETALLEENQQNCDPPLPDGEVRRIVASVGRYAPITVSVSVSSNDDWPEPASLKLELPPVEPFDLELLPRSLRPLVRDVSERMQAPADFMAAAAVVGLAASIGRRAFMQPKALDTTWRVVPNLWGAIVARPGFMKSPTIQAMMQPLRNIQANWFEENENAVAAFEREKERDALKISAWKESFKRATKAALPQSSSGLRSLCHPCGTCALRGWLCAGRLARMGHDSPNRADRRASGVARN